MKRTLILIMLFLGSVVTAFSQTQISSASGTINGHGYVDLGLSVKWATRNVGAYYVSDYGDYYAWGETVTKSSYTESNCRTNGKKMGNIAGNYSYDVARAKWGGTWRMPTFDELYELWMKCKWTKTKYNGTYGYKVTGPNGRSIFLPLAGWREESMLYGLGVSGGLWCSTPHETDLEGAYMLDYEPDDCFGAYWSSRSTGITVRPVTK